MAKKPKGKAKSAKVDDQASAEATVPKTSEVVSVTQPFDADGLLNENSQLMEALATDTVPMTTEETIVLHSAVENIDVVVVIEPKQTEGTHSIEHVAHQIIIGMRDEWLPSIRTRAALMGIPPTSEQTIATWKTVFKAWGGNNILKP